MQNNEKKICKKCNKEKTYKSSKYCLCCIGKYEEMKNKNQVTMEDNKYKEIINKIREAIMHTLNYSGGACDSEELLKYIDKLVEKVEE